MKNFCRSISELTEITEITEEARSFRGGILYDVDCGLCVGLVRRFAKTFRHRGFEFLPLQTAWIQQRLGLAKDARPEEMRVLTRDGRDFGGAAAVIFLARQIWWMWPLYALAQVPAMTRVIDRGYRWIATHRKCAHASDSACPANRALGNGGHRPPLQSWSPLAAVVPPVVALCFRERLAPWVFMWTMAGALFLSAKWLTFWRVRRKQFSFARALAYFLLWPGMDGVSVLGPRQTPLSQSARTNIPFPVLKICSGVVLVFGFARIVSPDLLQGWIGMIGVVLILHFGIFELIAIAWRSAGINVRPIMNAPIKSTALTEFWGRRWNGAFNQLVLDLLFRRLARSFGTTVATLDSFLLSGLLHELVISLPAAGGYGLPTGYFLLQGAGSIAQRKLRIRGKLRGWIFTMIIVVAPAFWLFHPLFVRRVVLPFMQAIGAL